MSAVLAVVLTLAALTAFVWLRAEPMINRALGIAEQRANAVTESVKPTPKIEGDPMPLGLYAFAMGESEEWARDAQMKVMREMYEESGDWNKVQTMMLIRESKERTGNVN